LSQLQSSFQTKLMLRQPFLRIQFQGKHWFWMHLRSMLTST
jgi:hypothetical protein